MPQLLHEICLRKSYDGEILGPVMSIGVGLASILAANEAINIVLRKERLQWLLNIPISICWT